MVGEDGVRDVTYRLTFRNGESFSRAVAELGEDVIDSNPRENSATVVIKDTNSDVRRALDILAEAGIAVQSLAVHKPTLDEMGIALYHETAPHRSSDVPVVAQVSSLTMSQ